MNQLQCEICHKWFKHLGSHLWHRHGLKANDYKMEQGLDIKTPLVVPAITLKQKANVKKQPTWRKNFANSFKYQFKPGKRQKSQYVSPVSRKRALLEIIKYNKTRKPERCPVCHIIYNHLDNHLANKHKLLRIK
jgi:hypothetical protein